MHDSTLAALATLLDAIVCAEQLVQLSWGKSLAKGLRAIPVNDPHPYFEAVSSLSRLKDYLYDLVAAEDRWHTALSEAGYGEYSREALILLQETSDYFRKVPVPRASQIRELEPEQKISVFKDCEELFLALMAKQRDRLPTLAQLRRSRAHVETDMYWYRLEIIRQENRKDGVFIDGMDELVTSRELCAFCLIQSDGEWKPPAKVTIEKALKDLAPENKETRDRNRGQRNNTPNLYRKSTALAHLKTVRSGTWKFLA